jgi:P-type Ca2+ transporter type 2C
MGKGGENYGRKENTSSDNSDGEIFKAWSKDVRECEEHFKVSVKTGLSHDEVENRRKIYGFNELEKHDGQSIWKLVLEQFNDTLVRFWLGMMVMKVVRWRLRLLLSRW